MAMLTGALVEVDPRKDVVELVGMDGSRRTFTVLDRIEPDVWDVEALDGSRHFLHKLESGGWCMIG